MELTDEIWRFGEWITKYDEAWKRRGWASRSTFLKSFTVQALYELFKFDEANKFNDNLKTGWIDCPTRPGLHYYMIRGSKVVRHCMVLENVVGQLFTVQNEGGPTYVTEMKRKWYPLPDPPMFPKKFRK